jgi:hypothetical protein
VKTARLIFVAAGIYGLIVLLPLFFIEPLLVPAPSRPEDYYGFLGSAMAFQFVYLTIGRDPVRYLALMPVAVLAKGFFFVTMMSLWFEGRGAPAPAMALAAIDGAIGFSFAYVWLRLSRSSRR